MTDLTACREAFEKWMLDVAKIIVGSSHPYPAGLERDYWRVWQAAWNARAEPAAVPRGTKQLCLPPGWVAVPIEPTEAMLNEFAGTPFAELAPSKQRAELNAYKCMLKIAPHLEIVESSGEKMANEADQIHAGHQSDMKKTHAHGARVVAWRMRYPSGALGRWHDGEPSDIDRCVVSANGAAIELAYGEPIAAPAASPQVDIRLGDMRWRSISNTGVAGKWVKGAPDGDVVEFCIENGWRIECAQGNGMASYSSLDVKMMVDRFLGWKLPANFSPDCGISFDKESLNRWPGLWPIGTNLLNADQAKEMFEYALTPATQPGDAELNISPKPSEHERAWSSVVDTLTEVAPWWSETKQSLIPMEQACIAIRRMAELVTLRSKYVPAFSLSKPFQPLVSIVDDGRIAVYIGGAYQFMDVAAARSLRDQINAVDQEKLA